MDAMSLLTDECCPECGQEVFGVAVVPVIDDQHPVTIVCFECGYVKDTLRVKKPQYSGALR